MTGAQRPGPGELDATELGLRAEAELLGTARELEWLAATEDMGPSADFADRVMAAVSQEPTPQPIAAAFGAARRRNPLAVLAALGDVWRVAFTSGRPFAARLPAIGLVALVVLGSLGVGVIGAGGLAGLAGPVRTATPVPSSALLGSPSPFPESPSPSPSPSPARSESPQPSRPPDATATPTPAGTPESSATPAATDDDKGRPTATPRPDRSPVSAESPSPDDDARPTETPQPTDASMPTETSGHDGGGHGGG
jgi:hypothetical protein